MGKLVDGTWQRGPLAAHKAGAFDRPDAVFRDRLGTAAHPIEEGRYHLYVAYACPWAHRTLITRALRGLTHAVSVTVVDPHLGEEGWEFRADDPDPFGGARYLYEVYTRSDAGYTGKVTVPVLWDKVTRSIVSNESREIMRMLDVDLAPLARDPAIATLPRACAPRSTRRSTRSIRCSTTACIAPASRSSSSRTIGRSPRCSPPSPTGMACSASSRGCVAIR